MQKDEAHRNKWALGLTTTISLFIFVSFAFYKGYLSFGNENIIAQKEPASQVANVISADLAPSPFENSKKTFEAAFGEINQQFNLFKESVSAVLVPFVTSIEVYERK